MYSFIEELVINRRSNSASSSSSSLGCDLNDKKKKLHLKKKKKNPNRSGMYYSFVRVINKKQHVCCQKMIDREQSGDKKRVKLEPL